MPINIFPVILQEVKQLSPQVNHFKFKVKHPTPFIYEPGQFINIHFEHEGKALKRSYSIANPPQEDNIIEFAAGFVANGPGTQLLFNLKVGQELQFSGPYGRLVLKNPSPKRYILVATSTGVTPYRAMLPALRAQLQQDPQFQVVIIEGVQTIPDLLYEQDFMDLVKDYPNRFSFRAQLSRESAVSLKTHYYKGYVQKSFAELSLNPQQDLVYLCGNPGMIDEAFEELKNYGFAVQQIIREKYVSR